MGNQKPTSEQAALLGAWDKIVGESHPVSVRLNAPDVKRIAARVTQVIAPSELVRLTIPREVTMLEIKDGLPTVSKVQRDMPVAFDEIQVHAKPSEVANLLVTDIVIGGKSFCADGGALPCDMFAPGDHEPFKFNLGIALPADEVVIVVANADDKPVEFRASLVGSPA